ncbi:ubiquitin-conjugating enzyme family protein (macronuclear) [Tetrahymena thermophila SB210]|uniref:Ubiquitin-conjugating enzyme family protein n=1 Tax=Tetrahymena thermophila (strain SB210) TaxID=312017 RepID=Q22YU7_TETTS|nr:ubiquitin-conjugating enzyme family protein [Tetrahymena thermophila SB210]EAR90574.1 ubiquitin-conjugating enzyme family protein [Tetrahymena thermophila SB210]|eukprot:XP_001010819.1 ubiquitin-conjugating enzyme family protein [Tetrahymena thermophila SB210]
MSQEREEILQKEITSVQDENDKISLDQKIEKLSVQEKYRQRTETNPIQMSPDQVKKQYICNERESSMMYFDDEEQFKKYINNQIVEKKTEEQFIQYLVFQKHIKQFLSVNSDSVFIDLFY